MRTVILTGDSHLGPLKRSMALDPSLASAPLVFWPLGKGAGAREAFFDVGLQGVTTTYSKWHNRTFSNQSLAEVSTDALLVVSLPLNTSRILRDYSWNRHVPWRLVKGEIALSDAVVSAMIEQDSQHAINFVIELQRIWNSVAVLEAPRFFRNASYLDHYRFDVCSYIDQTYRAQVSARLHTAGIKIIVQPSETIASDGTTDLAYDHENPDDDHHGNMKYGLATLRAVIDCAAR